MKTKPESNDRWDMVDYAEANQSLLSQIVVLETQLRAKGQAVPARPAAINSSDIISANDALNAHVVQLKVKASTTTQTAQTATVKNQTLTEKVLAARGVSNFEQLKTRRENSLVVED